MTSAEKSAVTGSQSDMDSHTVYKCNYTKSCRYTTTFRKCMSNHMKMHLNIMRYMCTVCSQTRSSIDNMRQHFNKFHPNMHDLEYKKFDCTDQLTKLECLVDKTIVKSDTRTRKNFLLHTRSQYKKTDKWVKKVNEKYSCTICLCKFASSHSIYTHLQSVHKVVRYHCGQCDFKHFRRSEVKKHARLQHNSSISAVKHCTTNCDSVADVPTNVDSGNILSSTENWIYDETCDDKNGIETESTGHVSLNSNRGTTGEITEAKVSEEDDGRPTTVPGTLLVSSRLETRPDVECITTPSNRTSFSKLNDDCAVFLEDSGDHSKNHYDKSKSKQRSFDVPVGGIALSTLNCNANMPDELSIENIKELNIVSEKEQETFQAKNKELQLKRKCIDEFNETEKQNAIKKLKVVDCADKLGEYDDKENKPTDKCESDTKYHSKQIPGLQRIKGFTKIGSQFHCSYCNVKMDYTSNHLNIYNHLLLAHNVSRYKCKLCNYKALFLSAINKHFLRAHKGEEVCCTYLSSSSNAIGASESNQRKIVSKKSYHRSIKLKNRNNKGNVLKRNDLTKELVNSNDSKLSGKQKVNRNNSRMLIHRSILDGMYKCTLCNFTCAHLSTVYNHIGQIHKLSRFQCHMCGYEHYFEGRVKNHFNFVHPGMKYHTNEINGMRHENSVTTVANTGLDNTTIETESCVHSIAVKKLKSFTIRTPNQNKQNYKKVDKCSKTSEISHKLHNCNQCDFSTKYIENLYRHLHLKHGQSRYRCSFCGVGYHSKKRMENCSISHDQQLHITCSSMQETVNCNSQPNTEYTVKHGTDGRATMGKILDMDVKEDALLQSIQNKMKVKYDILETTLRTKCNVIQGAFCFHDGGQTTGTPGIVDQKQRKSLTVKGHNNIETCPASMDAFCTTDTALKDLKVCEDNIVSVKDNISPPKHAKGSNNSNTIDEGSRLIAHCNNVMDSEVVSETSRSSDENGKSTNSDNGNIKIDCSIAETEKQHNDDILEASYFNNVTADDLAVNLVACPVAEASNTSKHMPKTKRKNGNKRKRRSSNFCYPCKAVLRMKLRRKEEKVRNNVAKEEYTARLKEHVNLRVNQDVFNTRPMVFIKQRKRLKQMQRSTKATFIHGLITNDPDSISVLLKSVCKESDMMAAMKLEFEIASRQLKRKKNLESANKSKGVDAGSCKGSKLGDVHVDARRSGGSIDKTRGDMATKDATCKGKKLQKTNQRYKCGWCSFRSVHSATILRHQMKKHPEVEPDIVKLRVKPHGQKSQGLSGAAFHCESCNFSGSLRHQLHIHNDRHHQGASNRDGITDYESDGPCGSLTPNILTVGERGMLMKACKQKTVEVKCVDFLQAGLDFIAREIAKVGVTKVCVDLLTEDNFVSMATKFKENVSFSDTRKTGFVPVDLENMENVDIRKLVSC